MLSAQALHTTGVYLLPKLRYQFAEFLLLSSLKRLGIFIPSTCVGLRYGLVQLKLRGFSWNHFNHFASYARSCHTLDLRARICLSAIFDTATGTSNTLMIFRDPSPIALYDGAGILTSFPSATHLCLALGPTHPAPMNVAQETLTYGEGLFTPLSLLMSAFALLIPPAAFTSHLRRLTERSPTACTKCTPAASVYRLAPLHLPRRTTRSVSYYAFFKGWLLLSQPPDCLCLPTSFPT